MFLRSILKIKSPFFFLLGNVFLVISSYKLLDEPFSVVAVVGSFSLGVGFYVLGFSLLAKMGLGNIQSQIYVCHAKTFGYVVFSFCILNMCTSISRSLNSKVPMALAGILILGILWKSRIAYSEQKRLERVLKDQKSKNG